MSNFKNRRKRLGGVVAVALGALAIVALPGLASARDDSGQSSATIESFDPDSRILTISLPAGETVSGLVTRRTKIRCEDQRGHRGRHGGDRVRFRGSGHGEAGDDNGGGREAEAGDDRGGRGVEPGDDNGGASGNSGSRGHDDNGRGANCTTADLVAGAAVEEVELDFDHGGVRFDEVELDD
ncbi:MAG TPA: hypothetical protein VNR67_04650 [Solirubrobacterales bacterium]|nr:hypothetical protein [Solirubrobacterales bacterium]